MTELVYMPYAYTDADGSKKVYEYLITEKTQKKLDVLGEGMSVKLISVLPDDDAGEHLVFQWTSPSGKTGGRLEVFQEYVEDDPLETDNYARNWGDLIMYAVCGMTIGAVIAAFVCG